MKNPSTNLKNPNIDMDKLCCSLRVQSIPEYGNEAAQRAVLQFKCGKRMKTEIVQPTLPDANRLSINYSTKTSLALMVLLSR